MKEYILNSIPHCNQRYTTCGDYFLRGKTWYVNVSEMGSEISEMAVSLHEAIECFLCELHGLKEPDIMAYDIKWEEEKDRGLHAEYDEPGDDPDAPYHKEHVFATQQERNFVEECGMTWLQHGKNVEQLFLTDADKKSIGVGSE